MDQMEELHWIATRARALLCLSNARGHAISRSFYQWRQTTILLACIEKECSMYAENASLASLLANARVQIVELTCQMSRVIRAQQNFEEA